MRHDLETLKDFFALRRWPNRMLALISLVLSCLGFWCEPAWAAPRRTDSSGKPAFSRVLLIVLENADPAEAMALPAFADLARTSALLTNYHAVAHPSQPNYIALIAGSTFGVRTNGPLSLPGEHLGNLLERQAKRWRVYAENYPGHCFLGEKSRPDELYTRKHVPFLSFQNVRTDSARCANIVNATAFAKDLEANHLPEFSLYVPNQINDGHHGGIRAAADWFAKRFAPLITRKRLPDDLLLAITCDEDEGREGAGNRVLAMLHGSMVAPGSRSDRPYTHYSLLKTIEEGLGLGTLGREDATAAVIQDIWTGGVPAADRGDHAGAAIRLPASGPDAGGKHPGSR